LGKKIKKVNRADVNNQTELTIDYKLTEDNFSNYNFNPIIVHWAIFERDLWPTPTRAKYVNPFIGNTPSVTYNYQYRSADECYWAETGVFYGNKSGMLFNQPQTNGNQTYFGNYLTENKEDNTSIKYNIVYY
jgi:hypothetical protein